MIHRPTHPVTDMAIWVKWRATSEAKDTCRSAPMGLTTNHLLHDEATHKSCLWKSPQTPGGTGTLTFKLYFIWKQKNTPSNIPLTMPSAYESDFAGLRKSSSSWTTSTQSIMLCHYGTFAVYFTGWLPWTKSYNKGNLLDQVGHGGKCICHIYSNLSFTW